MVTGRLRQRSWETPEGDKRAVTEIEADEVGASLKWATAKVERTSQRGNGDRTQGREGQAERSGDFNDAAPFNQQPLSPVPSVSAEGTGLRWGLCRGPRCRSLSVPCSSWHWCDRTVGRNVLGTVMAQAPRHG
jgi:hypothetical protein